MQKALCIKADVIGSRVHQHAELLPDIAGDMNEMYREHLLTHFSVRSGDELFVVLDGPESGFNAFKSLYAISCDRGIPLYVGIGMGTVGGGDVRDPDLINGTSIWRATDALSELRVERPETDILTRLRKRSLRYNIHVNENPEDNRLAECFLFFLMERVMRRTKKQQEAVMSKELHPTWSNEQHWRSMDSGDSRKRDNSREGRENTFEEPPSTRSDGQQTLSFVSLPEKSGELNAEYVTANFSKLLMRADYTLVREAEASFLHLLQLFEKETER